MNLMPPGSPVFISNGAAGPSLEAADRVRVWWEKASRVYPDNTKKAWRADWKVFLTHCQSKHASPLPTSPGVIASFVDACRLAGKKPATTRRYLSTITRAHRVAGLADPCADESVQLEIKGLYHVMSARQRQARALTWEHIKQFIDTAGEGIRATRERALVSVAYDLMARRAELVALEVNDLIFEEDGTGRALIRRSKTDQLGEGTGCYMTRDTVRWLKAWLKIAAIREGPIFRRIKNGGSIGEPLAADAVGVILKRVARYVGFSEKDAEAVSGHSIRVGATQDLLALNIDLGSVMQAGRWKSNRMPMRYGEQIMAARGGIARAAALQGRDAKDDTRTD
jgi:integrase